MLGGVWGEVGVETWGCASLASAELTVRLTHNVNVFRTS